MLTNNDAIRAAADLIAHCKSNENLAQRIWDIHLTDPETNAHDLTMIAVVAASLARAALDHLDLGTAQFIDQLTTLTHFEDITAGFHDDNPESANG